MEIRETSIFTAKDVTWQDWQIINDMKGRGKSAATFMDSSHKFGSVEYMDEMAARADIEGRAMVRRACTLE